MTCPVRGHGPYRARFSGGPWDGRVETRSDVPLLIYVSMFRDLRVGTTVYVGGENRIASSDRHEFIYQLRHPPTLSGEAQYDLQP